MADSLLNILINTDYRSKGTVAAQNALSGLKSGVKDTAASLLGLNAGSLTAVGIITGLTAAVKKCVDSYVTYADQVRQATNLTGMSAEETSRLIQISDDFGVSYDKLKTILQGANKAGFEPSIANIAALSDEYLALEDPVARNKLLIENFGKSGMDFAEVMKLGSEAILERADAVESGMILDEQALAASREYQMVLDDLEDTIQAASMALAQELIPALADVITFMTQGVKAGAQLISSQNTLKDVWEEHEQAVLSTAGSYEEYRNEVLRAAVDGKILTGSAKWAALEILNGGLSAEETAAKMAILSDKIDIASQSEYDSQNALIEFREAHDLAATAVINLTEAEIDYKDALKDLQGLIAGPVGKELDSYREKQEKISAEVETTQAKIEKLEKLRWLTPEQKADLEEAKQRLGELGDEATTAAEEHHQAMAKIIFDMANVRAAADGVITEAEYTALKNYATNMGMVDQSTMDAQYAMGLMQDKLAESPAYYENYDRALEAMTTALDDGTISAGELEKILGILSGQDWSVNVGVDVNDQELQELANISQMAGIGIIPMADGGDFMVTRPTLFLAGEAGVPERATFTPMPTAAAEPSQSGGGITINVQGMTVRNDMDIELIARRLAELTQRRH